MRADSYIEFAATYIIFPFGGLMADPPAAKSNFSLYDPYPTQHGFKIFTEHTAKLAESIMF